LTISEMNHLFWRHQLCFWKNFCSWLHNQITINNSNFFCKPSLSKFNISIILWNI